MAAEQAEQLREVDAATLKAWLDKGEATLIDVREEAEYNAAHIPGALLVPNSKFDPAEVARAAKGKLVVHCASGMRATAACARLVNSGQSNVYLFRPGVKGWREAGYQTEGGREKLPVIRQVQLIVGVGVIAGTALGVLVNPYFLVLPGFMGCGLFMAGATGFCPLANMLEKLPYNRCPSGSCGG